LALREAINAAPPSSHSELHAKERALEIEAARDKDFTNHGPGSVCELAKSLAAAVLAKASKA
jgi:hypothetical protein